MSSYSYNYNFEEVMKHNSYPFLVFTAITINLALCSQTAFLYWDGKMGKQ